MIRNLEGQRARFKMTAQPKPVVLGGVFGTNVPLLCLKSCWVALKNYKHLLQMPSTSPSRVLSLLL